MIRKESLYMFLMMLMNFIVSTDHLQQKNNLEYLLKLKEEGDGFDEKGDVRRDDVA